jgi:hypothetical protein
VEREIEDLPAGLDPALLELRERALGQPRRESLVLVAQA